MGITRAGGGTGGSGNAYTTIVPTTGTNPTATSSAETLTLTSSDASVIVTGTAASDTLDFKSKCLKTYTFVLANGVDLTTGTTKTNTLVVPRTSTIKKVYARANVGPTGAAAIFDINKNGTSIWNSTQANRIQIAASATTGTQTSFDTSSLAEGDELTIDCDQVGSTVAGQTITVQVETESNFT